jgi:hypothetical protein
MNEEENLNLATIKYLRIADLIHLDQVLELQKIKKHLNEVMK